MNCGTIRVVDFYNVCHWNLSSKTKKRMSSQQNTDISVGTIYHYNIIIFGESGVGKSALINLIYDRLIVKSSSQAIGCTTENAKVTGILEDQPHLSFDLYDTVGLSESAQGSVPTVTAFIQLIKLAYAIPNGINLLICCAEKGRISGERFESNYKIFKDGLCDNRIPCLLVLTRCDDEGPSDEWWTDNKNDVRNRLGFDFIDAVCVSTIKTKKKEPEKIRQEYVQSRSHLLDAIIKHSLRRPLTIDGWSRRVLIFARSLYNSFAKWLSWFGIQQAALRPELIGMFLELHYSHEDAKRETEKLIMELEQEDLLAPYQTIEVK